MTFIIESYSENLQYSKVHKRTVDTNFSISKTLPEKRQHIYKDSEDAAQLREVLAGLQSKLYQCYQR